MAVAACVSGVGFAAPAYAGEPIRLVLPQPTGRQQIGTTTLHLVDASRPDPWVADGTRRELMVQIWYPARDVRGYPLAPWVSPGVAAHLVPPDAGVVPPTTHAHLGAPVGRGRHPVVLYSPGFGLERTSSTALVEELAGHGYIVVTVDHTHDTRFVEFPDGRIETQHLPPPGGPADEDAFIAKALATRVADVRFTLDQLVAISRGGNPDREHRPLPAGLAGAWDLHRVGMFGHSLGGATAAEVMYEDPRVIAGVNMDGTVSGQVVSSGLDRPFLLLGSTRDTGDGDDDNWAALWSHLRGPRRQLELVGSGHMSFTDYQILLPQAGVPADALVPALGTIDPARSVAVQRAYLVSFFDRYLLRRDDGLLTRPSRCYPEMRFVA